jgi:hypothetical protein
MGHPVTTEFLDEHARPQPGHWDFLQHETGSRWKAGLINDIYFPVTKL